MDKMHDRLALRMAEMATTVRRRWDVVPAAGIVLGSGLGDLADALAAEAEFAYQDIPWFAPTSALGHRGRLVCGALEGRPVMAFQGRYHLYEGCSPSQVTLPVRLLQAMGAPTLILSNAAGGLNPRFCVGDVMAIDDHVNLMFANPLLGKHDERLGPRFPARSATYDARLLQESVGIARQERIALQCGVYVAMCGPCYETRAEYRFCRQLGGDAVGMSTAPEAIAARHAGMRVAGFSAIANVASPDAPRPTCGREVLAGAACAADKLATLIRGLVRTLPMPTPKSQGIWA